MMRRYLWDIGFIVLAALIAFLLAGTPEVSRIPATRPAPPEQAVAVPKSKTGEIIMATEKNDTNVLDERNIFALSGSYQDKAPNPVPDNPYVLIGVVEDEKTVKAIFRDYTGKVVNASKGQRMIDGFRVDAMDRQQILLKRGREQKIFNIYNPAGLSVTANDHGRRLDDEKPELIGVLEGVEKKAVFRRSMDGGLLLLNEGQTLPDGSVIVRIDSRLVKIRDGKTEKELAPGIKAPPQSQTGAADAGNLSVRNPSTGQGQHVRTKKSGVSNRARHNPRGKNP